MALRIAAANGFSATITALCEQLGFDPSGREDDAPTPIMLAAANGETRAVRRLILLGADVSSRDEDGMTALHHAAARPSSECVKLILETGADPGAKTYGGRETPLRLAESRRSVAKGRECPDDEEDEVEASAAVEALARAVGGGGGGGEGPFVRFTGTYPPFPSLSSPYERLFAPADGAHAGGDAVPEELQGRGPDHLFRDADH